jgi:hypothetical protein
MPLIGLVLMKHTRDKSLEFAKTICAAWKDTRSCDCKAYQRRFLFVNAWAAYNTAKSYWILHENKCFDDCVILARNLLERIFNSACAAKSPTHAVELISHELTEKIRHAKQCSPNAQAQLTPSINEHEKILQTLLGLMKKMKAPQWSYRRRAEAAGLVAYYLSGYFSFSRYAHAGYEVPRPEKQNQQSNAADFIALVAPVLTAANYHAVDCPDFRQGKCDVHAESMALLQDISLRTLGNNNGDIGIQKDKA